MTAALAGRARRYARRVTILLETHASYLHHDTGPGHPERPARLEAVLQGIADNTGTFRGFPFTGKIRYTRVFVRRAGRWQAVAMQQTSMQ